MFNASFWKRHTKWSSEDQFQNKSLDLFSFLSSSAFHAFNRHFSFLFFSAPVRSVFSFHFYYFFITFLITFRVQVRRTVSVDQPKNFPGGAMFLPGSWLCRHNPLRPVHPWRSRDPPVRASASVFYEESRRKKKKEEEIRGGGGEEERRRK